MSKWNKYTATKDWNNAFNRSGQPDLGGVINKGKTEEIKPDESGLIRTGYKTTSTEKELQDTSDEIRRYITRNNNRDLGVEVAKDEVYQYAVNNRIEAEDLELAPPDGCGMKPLYEDVDHPTDIEKFNMSRWENAVKQLDKDTTIRHKEYRQDMRNMISKIMEFFCSESIRQAIEKEDVFIEAQGETSDMTSFLEALDHGVRKLITPGLADNEIKDKTREDIKQMMLDLQIGDYCNSLLYIQKQQRAILRYKSILIKEKVALLGPFLDNAARLMREQQIKDEIQVNVDRDAQFIKQIYKEYYEFAMLPEYKQQHDRMITERKCGNETPYKREVVGGVVKGGLDNMLKEFTAIANASMQTLGQAVYIVKKKEFKRPLNLEYGKEKKPKYDIAINNQEIIVPCEFCLTTLKFEKGAANHTFNNCRYNSKNIDNYVGDAKKAERITKSERFNSGRQDQKSESQRGRGRGHRGRGRGRN